MRKQKLRKRSVRCILLTVLMFFSMTVRAADDWPATLYMEQSSFSSTGRVTATGDNGVYEFAPSFTSSTTAPKYFIFSTATTSVNAKKGTYKVFGASSIAEGRSVQPLNGVAYPLADLSSAEDATALIAAPTTCSFLPLYWANAIVKVKVDLNSMTVVFNYEDEPTVETLGIFSKTSTNALASSPVSADGIARYSIKVAAETNVYFAANTTTRTATANLPVWGAASQVNPGNVEVTVGSKLSLERTTYYQVYTKVLCSYTLPAGSYDIIADIKTGEVEFKPYTGQYKAKPATLNMRSNTFATSYGTATGVDGVYTFDYDKSTSSTASPVYIVFTDVTSLDKARTSDWVLGSTTDPTNLTPAYGKSYPLVTIDPDKANSDKTGTFMPVYPQNYSIVVDLNNMTVTFNPVGEMDAMDTIYMLDSAYKPAGRASKDADGKYRYSYHGAPGSKVFFSTGSDKDGMKTLSAYNFGAGGHANAENTEVTIGNTYDALPQSYYRIYNGIGMFVMPGRCDIEFDPNAEKVSFSQYSGKYTELPETLYMKTSAIPSTSLASATGVNGVYTFEYKTQTATTAPRAVVFTDAEKYSVAGPECWLFGASEDGKAVEIFPGSKSQLYDVNAADVYNKFDYCFMPLGVHTYAVTVDLNNMTVDWGEPVSEPASLNVFDGKFHRIGTTSAGVEGVYEFETRTYSSHPIFLSAAESSSYMQNSLWNIGSTSYINSANIDIANGATTGAARISYYQLNYNGRKGYWVTPEGFNRIKGLIDIRNNKAEWTIESFEPRPVEVLYVINSNMEVLGHYPNDNNGVFDFVLEQDWAGNIAFSDSKTGKGDPDRMFYGGGLPYESQQTVVEEGVDYPVTPTSEEAVSNYASDYYLEEGIWQVHLDMNEMKINFKNVSRGGDWYTPESLVVCNDDLMEISAAATAEEGVFTFSGITVNSESDIAKIVFMDPDKSVIFGSNLTGRIGPDVESGDTYDLYITKRLWVETDGASCFNLVPSTYDIKVDFNNATVWFFDPTIPVYPAKLQLLTMNVDSGETEVLSSADGNGSYRFYLDNTEAVTVALFEPEVGVYYRIDDTDFHIVDKASARFTESDTAEFVEIPEGIWTISIKLADMSVSFAQTLRPVYEATTMPEGSNFYSYFGVGTEPKAVFTFNNNIKSVANVWVLLGDYEGGVPTSSEKMVFGARSASIEENKVIVDFSGWHYDLPEEAEETKAYIILSKVTDTNNQVLVCEDVEDLPAGTLVFEYPFVKYDRIDIDAKFDLESGSNIDDVSEITFKVNRFDDLAFEGIVFAYPDPDYEPSVEDEDNEVSGEVEDTDENDEPNSSEDPEDPEDPEPEVIPMIEVPARWTSGAKDEDGYTPITVSVPMSVRGIGELQMYMSGLDIDDGYADHADDVRTSFITEFNPTIQITTDPAEGAAVYKISRISLTWTHPLISSVGNLSMKATLYDQQNDEFIPFEYIYPMETRQLLIVPEKTLEVTGKYLLSIPEGEMEFNDDPTAVNRPVTFLFEVDSTLGIDRLSVGDDTEVEIADINGYVIRRGIGKETLRGLNGIYIVNGEKCILGK